jgi:hypothetical protein
MHDQSGAYCRYQPQRRFVIEPKERGFDYMQFSVKLSNPSRVDSIQLALPRASPTRMTSPAYHPRKRRQVEIPDAPTPEIPQANPRPHTNEVVVVRPRIGNIPQAATAESIGQSRHHNGIPRARQLDIPRPRLPFTNPLASILSSSLERHEPNIDEGGESYEQEFEQEHSYNYDDLQSDDENDASSNRGAQLADSEGSLINDSEGSLIEQFPELFIRTENPIQPGIVEDTFGYGLLRPALFDDLLPIALFESKSLGNVSRQNHERYTSILSAVTGMSIPDFRTVSNNLARDTGIGHIRYDVCSNKRCSFAFTGDAQSPAITQCPNVDCATPRSNERSFDYIPLIHRLRLMFANHTRALELKSYQRSLPSDDRIRDIWDGEIIRRLKERGFFSQETDLAFALGTDGVQLFDKGSYTVWPIMLVIYNLSPEVRFLEENVICLGIIPGPFKPANIGSYLHPLINELKQLRDGINGVLDASTLSSTFLDTMAACQPRLTVDEFRATLPPTSLFTLRAHVVVVTSDMPARDELMGLTGHGSYGYCNYCDIQGIFNKHIYCPLTKPTAGTTPSNVDLSEWRVYNANQLPIRDAVRDECRARTEDRNFKKRTPLWDSDTVSWPWGYGIDHMHLFYLNVAKLMLMHWNGTMFDPKSDATLRGSLEDYYLKPDVWKAINEDMKKLRLPSGFGNKVRPIESMSTANELKQWVKIISPVVLLGRWTNPRYYEHWILFVEAVTISTDYNISRSDIERLRMLLAKFVVEYEEIYYRQDFARLRVCRATIHGLLHVADCVEMLGPMWSYAQWTLERMCGLWKPMVMQESNPSRNLSIALVNLTQMHYAKFCFSFPEVGEQGSKDWHWASILKRCVGKYPNSRSTILISDHQKAILHDRAGGQTGIYLQSRELGLLRYYLSRSHDQEEDDLPPESGYYATLWKRCKLAKDGFDQGLYQSFVRGEKFQSQHQQESSRDNSYVRYTINGETHFGQVKFFLSYQDTTFLAYIREQPKRKIQVRNIRFPLQRNLALYMIDRRLLSSQTKHYFINCDTIEAPVGLVINGGSQYFVEKHTCFFDWA